MVLQELSWLQDELERWWLLPKATVLGLQVQSRRRAVAKWVRSTVTATSGRERAQSGPETLQGMLGALGEQGDRDQR